jgi:hypothetical protein
MNYYEQVRDAVERIAQCTTSDAQGIIGAWGQTKHSPGDAGQAAIDEAEEAGTTPEDLARAILKMPKTDHSAEVLQALDKFFEAMSVGVSVSFRTAQQQRDGDAAYAALKEAYTKAKC